MMTSMLDIHGDFTMNIIKDDRNGHRDTCRILVINTEDKQLMLHFDTPEQATKFINNMQILSQKV